MPTSHGDAEREAAPPIGAVQRPQAAVSAAREVPPHIVDGARHVLAQDGLAAATLERISAAAGVSRMTLHRRGLSKGDILAAIGERLEVEYREAIWRALVHPGSARARLALALELQCGVAEENLEVLDALSSGAHDAIYHDANRRGLTRAVFVEPLERLLRDGAVDGSLAELDVKETATILFNLVGHTYRHLRSEHGWSAKRARDGVLRVAIEGVLPRAA